MRTAGAAPQVSQIGQSTTERTATQKSAYNQCGLWRLAIPEPSPEIANPYERIQRCARISIGRDVAAEPENSGFGGR